MIVLCVVSLPDKVLPCQLQGKNEILPVITVRVRLKPDRTRWRTGG